MSKRLGIVMDPIDRIHFHKDTSLALLLEAKKIGYTLFYMEQKDLFCEEGVVYAEMKTLDVFNDENKWFDFKDKVTQPVHELDVVLMRKDPPFNLEYIYTTYLLELVKSKGTLVVNDPQSLRDANEKVFTTWFPQCTPPTLIAQDKVCLKSFISKHDRVVLKPLHSMGGGSIFQLSKDDLNINVAIEELTHNETQFIMAQKFIPEITQTGDKRIILINGEPVPYALARMPAEGDIRGNLAAGGTGHVVELTERDRDICGHVGPVLKEKGLVLVGIDVIGDYLTEINVTSPTCIREIENETGLNIAEAFFKVL